LKTSSVLPEGRTWYIFNKVDLVKDKEPWTTAKLPAEKCAGVSCQTQVGLDRIITLLEGFIQTPAGGEDVVLTSARHRLEVEKAEGALRGLLGLMKNRQPYELWAEELREAALAIGRIRGRDLPAKAFEDIFTKFCIGK